MITVDIEEAKKDLSRLVEQAANGEPFIIAKDGKPLVKVCALESAKPASRIGFLEGEFDVPDDFDRMFEDEIAELFEGESPSLPR